MYQLIETALYARVRVGKGKWIGLHQHIRRALDRVGNPELLGELLGKSGLPRPEVAVERHDGSGALGGIHTDGRQDIPHKVWQLREREFLHAGNSTTTF